MRRFIFLFIMTASLTHLTENVFAEEHGGAEKEAAKGEEKPEKEGGEKKSGASTEGGKPWVAITGKITGLANRRKSLEGELEELFKKKKTLGPQSSEMRALVKEVDEKYKKLVETTSEERKQIQILQFRYPERANEENHAKEKPAIPSLKEMEKEKTLQDQLQENYELMKKQYNTSSGA